MTAPRSSSFLGPQPQDPEEGCFCFSGLLDAEQLDGLHSHLAYIKGAIVLIESEFPLCLDNSEVTPPHSLTHFASLHHLGHLPKLPPGDSASPHLLAEFFVGNFDHCLLCVWAGEAVPSYRFLIRVSGIWLGLTVWVRLLDTLVNFACTDVPCKVSAVVSGVLRDFRCHPIIGVHGPLDWTGEGVSELRPRLVVAAASSCSGSVVRLRLSRWKDALIAVIGSHGLGKSLLTISVIECTIRRAISLLVPGIDGECKEWVPNWGASSWYVWYGESKRRQSDNSMCWAVHKWWSLRSIRFWSSDVHPQVHHSGECFPHRVYGTCPRIDSGWEKTGREPHETSLTHLGSITPWKWCQPAWSFWPTCPPAPWSSCSTGPPVHWSLWPAGPPFLGYSISLVLMSPKEPFPFEKQFPLKLSFGLSGHLQLPQGSTEANHLLGLRAHVFMWVGTDRGDWQWHKGGQTRTLIWAHPKGFLEKWDDP